MRRWTLFLLLAFFLSAGCATLPLLLPPPPPAEELVKQVGAQLQAFQGLKGLAQVKVSSAARSFRAQEVLFVQRPGFLRVESLGPLGTPQLYMVTDGLRLNIYNPGENRYYRGLATANHLSSALPVPLEPEEAVAFLLGGLPLIDYESCAVRRDREEGLWILDLLAQSRDERQSIWVHPRSFQMVRVEIQRAGSSRRLTFGDFCRVQGFSFPKRIQLISFAPPAQISVEYEEVELNPSWKDGDFSLPVPRGAQIIPLE